MEVSKPLYPLIMHLVSYFHLFIKPFCKFGLGVVILPVKLKNKSIHFLI